MSDIFRDFDKKNEIPKVKIPKFATGGICNDGIFPKGDYISDFEKIAKDIVKRQDNAKAMEFTKCIGELLRKNGVIPKITEYTRENVKESSIEKLYGVSIDELDFTEHDKAFENKIAKLQIKNDHLVDEKNKLREIINKKLGGWDDYGVSFEEIFGMRDENNKLKQRIADLESKGTEICKNEPKISDSAPSMEWYENRHQSDCIEINRLNTTIDVLIHKVEYLRQFVGLE